MEDRKYAVILGNLGNTKDRFCGSYKQNPFTEEMLEKASKIPYVKGIELVGTWNISQENPEHIHIWQEWETLSVFLPL